MVKNLPAMQETRVQSLSQKDPLEKEMTTHPSILAWRIPWTEEPGRLQSMGSQKSQTRLKPLSSSSSSRVVRSSGFQSGSLNLRNRSGTTNLGTSIKQ